MSDYEDARARVNGFLQLWDNGDEMLRIAHHKGAQRLFYADLEILAQVPANINAGRIDELFARLDRMEERMRPSAEQAEPEQSPRPESDYGEMRGGGDMPGPEDVACLKCGSYAIDHDNGPERAHQFCPDRPDWQRMHENCLHDLAKAEAERDKAKRLLSSNTDAGITLAEQRDKATARAKAADARLHRFEEAGMDNVRRMERAEATVARVVTLRDRLVRIYVSGSAFHDVAKSITKALDGTS